MCMEGEQTCGVQGCVGVETPSAMEHTERDIYLAGKADILISQAAQAVYALKELVDAGLVECHFSVRKTEKLISIQLKLDKE